MSIEDRYVEYAEALSDLVSLETNIHNKRRLVSELKLELNSKDNDGSFGVEFTAHAFKQISERLEELALEYPVIYQDVFKESPSESILLPSNLKTFVITLLADARKKNNFRKEESKNTTEGFEFRYIINMNKWSNEKTLQFIAIVEGNFIKTGFFNWVKEQ